MTNIVDDNIIFDNQYGIYIRKDISENVVQINL